MTKKQKKVLIRIIISAVLLVAFKLICYLAPVNKYVELVLFLIPYLVIGYDILKKAVHGIFHGEVFDENFLMAIATVGVMFLTLSLWNEEKLPAVWSDPDLVSTIVLLVSLVLIKKKICGVIQTLVGSGLLSLALHFFIK